MQGWFYEDVSFHRCVSAEAGGNKKHVPIIFFPFNCCISDKCCNLSFCETCKSATAHTSTPSPAAAVAVFFSFFLFLDVIFLALKFSTPPLQSGLSAHTALHKLNSPLFKPWQALSVWICIARLHSSREGGGWWSCHSRNSSYLSVTVERCSQILFLSWALKPSVDCSRGCKAQ